MQYALDHLNSDINLFRRQLYSKSQKWDKAEQRLQAQCNKLQSSVTGYLSRT